MVKKLNKAIILAAGKGSRLRKVLKGNPKPLLGIGKSTLLEILIKKLKDLKIKKILVVTGYKSNQIKIKSEKVLSAFIILILIKQTIYIHFYILRRNLMNLYYVYFQM